MFGSCGRECRAIHRVLGQVVGMWLCVIRGCVEGVHMCVWYMSWHLGRGNVAFMRCVLPCACDVWWVWGMQCAQCPTQGSGPPQGHMGSCDDVSFAGPRLANQTCGNAANTNTASTAILTTSTRMTCPGNTVRSAFSIVLQHDFTCSCKSIYTTRIGVAMGHDQCCALT